MITRIQKLFCFTFFSLFLLPTSWSVETEMCRKIDQTDQATVDKVVVKAFKKIQGAQIVSYMNRQDKVEKELLKQAALGLDFYCNCRKTPFNTRFSSLTLDSLRHRETLKESVISFLDTRGVLLLKDVCVKWNRDSQEVSR